MVIYIYYQITLLYLNCPLKTPFGILGSLPPYWNQFISKLLHERSSLLSYLALRICNLLRLLAFSLMNKCFSLEKQIKFILTQADLEGNRGEILPFKDICCISLKSQTTHFSLLPNIYYLIVSFLTLNSVVRLLESRILLLLL